MIFSVVFVAILLMGCSVAVRQDQIGPVALAVEQQELINLLSSHDSEILIFDFETVKAYGNLAFWLEIYEYGRSVEKIHGMHLIHPDPQPLDGRLAIIINRDRNHGKQNFQWTFIVAEDGARASSRSESSMVDYEGLANAFGPINTPVVIQDGVEIILHTSIFSRDGIMTFGDQQLLLEQPELIEQYPYVHMIKARFSN